MKKKLVAVVLVAMQLQSFSAFADDGGHGGGGWPGPGPVPTQTHTTHPGPGPTHTSNPDPTPTVTQTSAPTPTPTPTDTTPSTPQPNPGAAESQGNSDGQAPGSREGQERGMTEGRAAGVERGYREGKDRCEREEAQKAYDHGFFIGMNDGRYQGSNDGQNSGRQDGDNDGRTAGTNDGQSRADHDAQTAAAPAGAQTGTAAADRSDAAARGAAEGTAAGDSAAQDDAQRVDFERGRSDYRKQRVAIPVDVQDAFPQKTPLLIQAAAKAQSGSSLIKNFFSAVAAKLSFSADSRSDRGDDELGNANPDFRYFNPTRIYPTPEETTAYQRGYRSGYINGFNGAYGQAFNQGMNQTRPDGERRGCDDARRENYDASARQGYTEGRQKGYSDTFHLAHDAAYKTAYDYAFRANSDSAYRASYQDDYNRYFSQARDAAYQREYGEIYQAAFDPAKEAKYNDVYPQYAARQYKAGQAAEAQDFVDRPIRLMDAQITETIVNGLFEPGEPLRVKLTIRNFSDQAIAAQNVKLTVQAIDTDGTVVSIPVEVLARNLKPNSVTTVSEALEIGLTESAIGKSKRFSVSVFFKERNCGDQTVSAQAQYMMDAQLAEEPVLSEGIQTMISVRVTNKSQVASDAGSVVTLNSDPNVLTVVQSQQTVPALQPGESTIVSFPVIGVASENQVDLQIGIAVNLPNGRKVGALSTVDEVPVRNDYKITLNSGLSALRQAGITRVQYTISNQSSRLSYKGLQLKISVKGDDGSTFQVLGPNPQLLVPVEQGKSTSFVIPILSSQANSGGTILLTVQEDGRTVVISQEKF